MDLLYQPQCIWIDEYPEHGRLHAGWTPILAHDIYRPDSSGKNSITHSIEATLRGPSAALLKGILLGQRQQLPDELLNTFSMIGLTHILAVSGLHVGLITLIMITLFFILRIPKVGCCRRHDMCTHLIRLDYQHDLIGHQSFHHGRVIPDRTTTRPPDRFHQYSGDGSAHHSYHLAIGSIRPELSAFLYRHPGHHCRVSETQSVATRPVGSFADLVGTMAA